MVRGCSKGCIVRIMKLIKGSFLNAFPTSDSSWCQSLRGGLAVRPGDDLRADGRVAGPAGAPAMPAAAQGGLCQEERQEGRGEGESVLELAKKITIIIKGKKSVPCLKEALTEAERQILQRHQVADEILYSFFRCNIL